MKRIWIAVVAVLAGLPSGSALASAGRPSSAARSARITKVALRHTSLGTILVTGSGLTLYRFTRDPSNKDTCASIHECLESWPALRSSGRLTAGLGVRASLLSTIPLAGGGRQVTYAHHPLYTYAAATERGETFYVGAFQFGGTWDALNAAGALVK